MAARDLYMSNLFHFQYDHEPKDFGLKEYSFSLKLTVL